MFPTTTDNDMPNLDQHHQNIKNYAKHWFLGLCVLFIIMACLPIFALFLTAFQGDSQLWAHLIQYVLPPALLDTFILLLGVGVFTITIGTTCAWIVTAYEFKGRAIVDWALLLPLAVPTYIIAYSYIDILHPIGPLQTFIKQTLDIQQLNMWWPNIRSMWGCILLLSFVLYPYVYLSTRAMFLMQSSSLIEVSRSLGLNQNQIFYRVALPLARPAIAVGASLALMETLNDIGATEFLGVKTLTLSIYSTWVNQSNLAGAAQIAIFMLMLVLCLVFIERFGRRKQRYMNAVQRSRVMSPIPTHGTKGYILLIICSLPIVLGFIIPTIFLIFESIQRIKFSGISSGLVQSSLNTLMLALVATGVTVVIGLLIASSARFTKRPILNRISSLGYAVPGTVLAIGLLIALGTIDHALADFLEFQFGIHSGLFLLGTSFTLIYAYSARFLAMAVGGAESGYDRIHYALDDAAKNLGHSPNQTLWRVHAPLLRPALVSSALLIFVDCMKELPATLLLRPMNMETLATQIYAEASRGSYEDGALAALLIVLVGLIPVILLAKLWRNVLRPNS